MELFRKVCLYLALIVIVGSFGLTMYCGWSTKARGGDPSGCGFIPIVGGALLGVIVYTLIIVGVLHSVVLFFTKKKDTVPME